MGIQLDGDEEGSSSVVVWLFGCCLCRCLVGEVVEVLYEWGFGGWWWGLVGGVGRWDGMGGGGGVGVRVCGGSGKLWEMLTCAL